METKKTVVPRQEAVRVLPEIAVAYLEVLSGQRQPEQLARYVSEKFYSDLKYRVRREKIARQLTGVHDRPAIRLITSHLASSAKNTYEVVSLVSISGKILALTISTTLLNGRHRVVSIDLITPTS